MEKNRGKHKLCKRLILGSGAIILVVASLFVFLRKKENQNSRQSVRTVSQNDKTSGTATEKQTEQTHTLNGYTVRLKEALYSERTKNGYCVFEVESEDGEIAESDYKNGNQIRSFGQGKDKISICMLATGTIRSRAEVKDKKLIIYTDFKADSVDSEGVDDFNAHQIYLYSDKSEDLARRCAAGEYGFKLEDNVDSREILLDDGSVLSLSCMGVSLTTNQTRNCFQVEISDIKGEKKLILNSDYKTDVAGNFSTGYSDENGQKQIVYSNSYKERYEIENIKEIYVNGKKI